MPIKRCTLSGGGKGYKWGNSGKCYKNRADCVRQMRAIFASGYSGASLSEGFRQALASEGLLEDKDALEVLDEIISEEIEEKLKGKNG